MKSTKTCTNAEIVATNLTPQKVANAFTMIVSALCKSSARRKLMPFSDEGFLMVKKNEEPQRPLTEKERDQLEGLKDNVDRLSMKAKRLLKWSCCGEDGDSPGCRGGGECEIDRGYGY